MSSSDHFVRPYMLTGGRAKVKGADVPFDAPVVALVLTDELDASATPETHSIVTMCATPVPVAEIAARLKVPLGIARVLVGDLAQQGTLRISLPGSTDKQSEVKLLERLLDGIRAL